MWEKTLALMFNESIKPRRLLRNCNLKKKNLTDVFYYIILEEKKISHQVQLQFRVSSEQ